MGKETVLFVGVKCPLHILERREKARKNRVSGLARYQFNRVHKSAVYDVEVDTSEITAAQAARKIVTFMNTHSVFEGFKRTSGDLLIKKD